MKKLKKLISLLTIFAICFANLSPAFAITEDKYQDIWKDYSKEDKDSVCQFLTSLPKLDVCLEQDGRLAKPEDITVLLTTWLDDDSSHYKDENLFDFNKYSKDINTDLQDGEFSEEEKVFGTGYVDFISQHSLAGGWEYDASEIDNILKNNYGLKPNHNFEPKMEDLNMVGYSNKFNAYIVRTYVSGRNYGYSEYIPQKMFMLKDDIVYAECLCNRYSFEDELFGSYECYFIWGVNDDNWRLYEYSNSFDEGGRGWLSDQELKSKLEYIDCMYGEGEDLDEDDIGTADDEDEYADNSGIEIADIVIGVLAIAVLGIVFYRKRKSVQFEEEGVKSADINMSEEVNVKKLENNNSQNEKNIQEKE